MSTAENPVASRYTHFDPGTSPRVRRIRVLVVDDSVVIRRFISRIVAADPAFEVVGYATNGREAIEQTTKLLPDAITMDIEMPDMDGLEAVRQLRALRLKTVIVMCSTLTLRGAEATLDALMYGANDYVTKPASSNGMSEALGSLSSELLPKLKQFFPFRAAVENDVSSIPARKQAPARQPGASLRTLGYGAPGCAAKRFERPRIVAIGVSTGGPGALMDILPQLPASFPLPIVIVQHMPPVFTKQLAERLNGASAIEVVEAASGLQIVPGKAFIAPGDFHLRLKRTGSEITSALDQQGRENSCRPAVDVLFRSVAELYESAAVGLILTGMGQDGLLGAEVLKNGGAHIIAQDQASSVVWGMPGAVVEAGLADEVVRLGDVAKRLIEQVSIPCR